MDPLAVTAAAMVAAALASVGEQVGRGAWALVGRAVDLVRTRLPDIAPGGRALPALERAPDDQASLKALAAAVELAIAVDPDFRAELTALLEEARRDPGSGHFVTEVYNGAQVGKLVNIGRARDVSV